MRDNIREKLLAKRIIWTITLKEVLLWLLFFVSYCTIYYFALVSIRVGKPAGVIDKPILLDISIGAGVQAILTLPIWWIIFRKLKDRSLTLTLLAHIACATIFLYIRCWVESTVIMYVTNKQRGVFSFWFAYYLPFLFYLVQFGIMHAYNFWLKSQRQLQKEKELLSLAYQSEVNALKAQIQPHFLFNTLNSISATMPPEMEATRVMIARLADTFRYALRSTQKHEVTLAEELDFIHTWIELEMHRFKSRLRVEFDTDESVLQILIPPMLLQPLVENAVKHGIGASISGGTIKISCIREEQYAKITISDTGAGFKGDWKQLDRAEGIGLKNTRQRLRRLYNEELFVQANYPNGFTSYFYIPL